MKYMSVYPCIKLDTLDNTDEINQFKMELKDRFGDIPKETQELIKTIPLRNYAKKLVWWIIKNNKLGVNLPNNESYFNSAQFSGVLSDIQKNKNNLQLREKK